MKKMLLAMTLLLIIVVNTNIIIGTSYIELEHQEREQICKQKFLELQQRYIDLQRTRTSASFNDENSQFFDSYFALSGDLSLFVYGDDCTDTYWGIRGHIFILENNYYRFGSSVKMVETYELYFEEVMRKIENIEYEEIIEKSIWEKIIDFVNGVLNVQPKKSIVSKEFIPILELKKEVVYAYLAVLSEAGDCFKFLQIHSYFSEDIDNMNKRQKNYLSNNYQSCDRYARNSQVVNFLSGQSFLDYYAHNSFLRNPLFFFKKKRIDIYFYNDYGMSKEEFEQRVNSFKEIILRDAPDFEFLGKEKYAQEPRLNFIAKYIDFNESQCQIKNNKEESCDCDSNYFYLNAYLDGADVFFIITPDLCRSWARAGFHSVISWPELKLSHEIIQEGYETNTYEYLEEHVILHELGHLVWGLADEYVEETKGKFARFPNCADGLAQANLFWYSLKGYYEYYDSIYGDVDFFEGCSYVKSGVFRPTINSIMNNYYLFSRYPRTPPVFGPVSDYYITRLMNIYEEIPVTNYLASKGHLIELNYEGEELTYNEHGLSFLTARRDLSVGMDFLITGEDPTELREYSWEQYSVYEELLDKDGFNIPKLQYVSRLPECFIGDTNEYNTTCDPLPSLIEIENPSIVIGVPYNRMGKRIDILKGEEVLLTIDTSKYLDYCGDGVCSDRETMYTCSIDCEEEIIIYGFMEGRKTDFYAHYSTISGTGPVDIVHSKGGCSSSINNCVEFLESQDEINIFMKSHSDVYVFDSNIYDVNVHYESGTGNVYFETENSKAIITSNDLKVSFSEWDTPKITKTTQNVDCVSIFDPRSEQKLFFECQ